jgi:hypothetical protein
MIQSMQTHPIYVLCHACSIQNQIPMYENNNNNKNSKKNLPQCLCYTLLLRGGGSISTPVYNTPIRHYTAPPTTNHTTHITSTITTSINGVSWRPLSNLPFTCSDHPLERLITSDDRSLIQQSCQFEPHHVLVCSRRYNNVTLTASDLRDLISHNSMINDNTIFLYLEILCSHFNLSFLCPQVSLGTNVPYVILK